MHIFVDTLDPALVGAIAGAIRDERPVALAVPMSRGVESAKSSSSTPTLGETARWPSRRGELLARGRDRVRLARRGGASSSSSFAPRPSMYVFGAIDYASALATIGRFLGYHVTVATRARSSSTPERFPDVDELVVDWPDEFLRSAPVDERTAICVLTHDNKFDVPILKVALAHGAGYIGAMGSRRTTERRTSACARRASPTSSSRRVHAPIGLPIGSRTPEEVAVAIAAEIISVFNEKAPRVSRQGGRVVKLENSFEVAGLEAEGMGSADGRAASRARACQARS